MLFVIRYVIDQYKTQEICDKVILKNDGMLMFNDKAVDNYTCGLAFVPNCYKIQKMCNKAIDASPSATEFVPECYKIIMFLIGLLRIKFFKNIMII